MLLEGFYILAKILVLYIQRLYYKDPIVMNENFAQIDKPTILVSNHPNTLLDAIFAAATVSEQVKFLANYSLFKSKFGGWFFNTFYCLPVQRPEDIEGGKTNNKTSIAKSHQHLADGGTLYVAAEGYSIHSLGIRPLKTGAARLALGTEEELDWNAEIQILPVGLNYEEADRFRSNLVVHVGKPYTVKEWRSEYIQDPRSTVKKVTGQLEDQMKSVLLHSDAERTDVFKKIRSYLNASSPTDPKREYLRSRKLLFDLNSSNVEEVQTYANEIQQFEDNCSISNYSGVQVAQAFNHQNKPIQLSRLIASLPITIIGFLTNVIPYLLCHWIEQKGNKTLEYRSTYRTMSGMILFPLMYLFWMWLISFLTNNVILTLGSVLVYRRSGIYAWHQIKEWSNYFCSNKIIKHDPQHIDQLKTILSSIDQLSV